MPRAKRSVARPGVVLLGAFGLLVPLLVGTATGQVPDLPVGGAEPVVRFPVASDTSPSLRSLEPLPLLAGQGPFKKGRLREPRPDGPGIPDPVLQGTQGGNELSPPNVSFEGISNDENFPFGVIPPDTNGEIGPNHYVQMVNLSFAVYDRAGNRLLGPLSNNTIWAGFPGECGIHNQGDPIVVYDQLADRWLLSQFAFTRDLFVTGLPVGPYFQCIAISATADPTGVYHRYEYLVDANKLNDYPKFGVWPDAYYASYNLFDQRELFAFAGAGASAFERDKMLVGDPLARHVFFDYGLVDERFGGQLPSDLEGTTLPPAGAPNYFVEADDGEFFGFPTDRLSIFEFHVDWTNPANSTFDLARSVDTAPFDSSMCGFARDCIPQPSPGFPLDAISDRVMFRLPYRNFGTHEALVINHTVDAGDVADHAGIRWYELRDPGGAAAIHQQGTFAPDGDHRWMGSIAQDVRGNVALGYSVSGPSTFPSIRYTGRMAGDPPGVMTLAEATLHAGGGAQTSDSSRWGDYSDLTVDPADDCTFWYTTEYYPETSGSGWHTRIGSFVLPDCAAGPVALNDSATTTENEPVTVDVLANDSDPNGDVLTVTEVSQGANGSAVNNGDGTVTYTPNLNFVGEDSFTYTISDPSGRTDSATVEVTVVAFCPLEPAGSFTDDFEPDASPGWEVDTAANDLGPLSPTWQVITDPRAQSPTHSFFSDATTLDLKDDRLVAPAQSLSATSRVVFWHQFNFEDSFDGGVLELSTDGGDTWVDVVAGGGSFVEGGYNGSISTEFGSPIAGRDAWTGGFLDAAAAPMMRVEASIGAFAGTDVLIRWRLAADPLVIGSLPGQGWWIDDVEVTDTLRVSDCNRPPIARDDEANTVENTPVTIDVLANDTDPEGDAISVTSVTQPDNGTATDNGDGTVTYTPNFGFTGVDSFTYTISDGNATDTANVRVFVTEAPNAVPDAVDDEATTVEDTPVTVDVLANDTDADDDTLTVTSVSQPANGSATNNGDGTVTYSPDPGFTGTDQFTYSISDGRGGSDTATVHVTVEEAPNRDPDAVDDSATTSQDTPVTIDVLANDTDPDGDALTVTSLTQPANGSATNNGDGTVTYSPNAGFSGTDVFTYTISDGHGGSDTATVSVVVFPPPPPGGNKVTGGGTIPVGDGEGKFSLNAQSDGPTATGKLSYRASARAIVVKGTITAMRISGSEAELSGTCTLKDGSACTFTVNVEDNSESGAGADRFAITVFDATGRPIHEADGILTKGNIQIHGS
jgi:hypothetical protein